jgi:hypothetical protein
LLLAHPVGRFEFGQLFLDVVGTASETDAETPTLIPPRPSLAPARASIFAGPIGSKSIPPPAVIER